MTNYIYNGPVSTEGSILRSWELVLFGRKYRSTLIQTLGHTGKTEHLSPNRWRFPWTPAPEISSRLEVQGPWRTRLKLGSPTPRAASGPALGFDPQVTISNNRFRCHGNLCVAVAFHLLTEPRGGKASTGAVCQETAFPKTQKPPNVLCIPSAAKVSLCPTPALKCTV